MCLGLKFFYWKAEKAGQCGCQRYKITSNGRRVSDGAKQEQKEWQQQTNWCCSSLCCFPFPSQIRKWRNRIRLYYGSPIIRRTPLQRHNANKGLRSLILKPACCVFIIHNMSLNPKLNPNKTLNRKKKWKKYHFNTVRDEGVKVWSTSKQYKLINVCD